MSNTAMDTYIGVKIVKARNMDRGSYCAYRGWSVPKDENPNDTGFLVEYEDGYESWCPTKQFVAANRKTTGMPFGHAIEAMKKGRKVARRGWNGKGIFIALHTPSENSKMTGPYIYIDTTGLQTDNEDAPKSRVPWLASQTDMLSDDWMVLE